MRLLGDQSSGRAAYTVMRLREYDLGPPYPGEHDLGPPYPGEHDLGPPYPGEQPIRRSI